MDETWLRLVRKYPQLHDLSFRKKVLDLLHSGEEQYTEHACARVLKEERVILPHEFKDRHCIHCDLHQLEGGTECDARLRQRLDRALAVLRELAAVLESK